MNEQELINKIQLLMHQHGLEHFTNILIKAAYNASDDTQDFDDKSLTQAYRHFANELTQVMDNTPKFDSNVDENETCYCGRTEKHTCDNGCVPF